jgi:hypothetical protein
MDELKVEVIQSKPKKPKQKKDLTAPRKRPPSNYNIFLAQQYDSTHPGYNELMALPGKERRGLISSRWKDQKLTFERPETYSFKRDRYQSDMKIAKNKIEIQKTREERVQHEKELHGVKPSISINGTLTMHSMDEEPIKRSRQRKPKVDFSVNQAPQAIPQEPPVIRKRAIIPMRREANNQVISDRSSQ